MKLELCSHPMTLKQLTFAIVSRVAGRLQDPVVPSNVSEVDVKVLPAADRCLGSSLTVNASLLPSHLPLIELHCDEGRVDFELIRIDGDEIPTPLICQLLPEQVRQIILDPATLRLVRRQAVLVIRQRDEGSWFHGSNGHERRGFGSPVLPCGGNECDLPLRNGVQISKIYLLL